ETPGSSPRARSNSRTRFLGKDSPSRRAMGTWLCSNPDSSSFTGFSHSPILVNNRAAAVVPTAAAVFRVQQTSPPPGIRRTAGRRAQAGLLTRASPAPAPPSQENFPMADFRPAGGLGAYSGGT